MWLWKGEWKQFRRRIHEWAWFSFNPHSNGEDLFAKPSWIDKSKGIFVVTKLFITWSFNVHFLQRCQKVFFISRYFDFPLCEFLCLPVCPFHPFLCLPPPPSGWVGCVLYVCGVYAWPPWVPHDDSGMVISNWRALEFFFAYLQAHNIKFSPVLPAHARAAHVINFSPLLPRHLTFQLSHAPRCTFLLHTWRCILMVLHFWFGKSAF